MAVFISLRLAGMVAGARGDDVRLFVVFDNGDDGIGVDDETHGEIEPGGHFAGFFDGGVMSGTSSCQISCADNDLIVL